MFVTFGPDLGRGVVAGQWVIVPENSLDWT